MPVYNVEKYLKDAVNSVLAQTYPHFELILVNDASTDGSPDICDELALADERIKVIHKKENKGLSQARNSGIDMACGDYIYFMDSDDTVDGTLFQAVADSLQTDPAQAVFLA